MKARKNEKTLRPVWPNAGIEADYRRRLKKLIKEMADSAEYWIAAAYKANEPAVLASDELPATALKRAMRKLAGRWQKEFDELAPKLAAHFAKSAANRSDAALRQILREAGFTVKFQATRAVQDILQATIAENVSLITNIPEQFFTGIEGAVYRSVTAGRDLASLTKELHERYGIEQRRAAAISLDQNNKVTSAITRARRIELNLFEADWMHSHAGRKPRPAHVKMSGKRFDIRKGMWDDHEKKWVQPGQLVRCRCSSRPVIKGLT